MSDEHAQDMAVRRLLRDVVDSFEKLELVVQVSRGGVPLPTTPVIAAALGLAPTLVAEALSELAQAQAVVLADREGGGWGIDGEGPWAAAIAVLARLYDEDRIRVLDLMTRTSLERVRTQAARAFADAFVLRSTKKEPDG
jgi:hypothetical protein